MSKIKLFIFSLLAVATIAANATPQASAVSVAQFAKSWSACGGEILGLPPWYKHLQMTNSCSPKITKLTDVWVIALNVVELLMRVAGLVALGFVIWGGFKYMKSQGDPGKISEAKEAILHAIIGLVITIGAVVLVQFIAGSLA